MQTDVRPSPTFFASAGDIRTRLVPQALCGRVRMVMRRYRLPVGCYRPVHLTSRRPRRGLAHLLVVGKTISEAAARWHW